MIGNAHWKFLFNTFLNSLLENLSLKFEKPLTKPTVVYLGISRKCCARCIMCSCWQEDSNTDLPLDLAKKIIIDLKKWLGTCLLQCGGGEPFMNKEFMNIVEFAVKNGVIVGIVSNAFLINKEVAEKIITSGVFNVNISIDGIKKETHDYLRGVKGAYEKTLNAINYLAEAKRKHKSSIKIILKPIIMGYNLNEITELVHFSKKIDGITGINFQPLSEVTPQTKDLWIKDMEQLDKVIDELISMKKRGLPILNSISNLQQTKLYFRKDNNLHTQPCSLGYRNLFIDQYGDVSLCGNGFPSIGNIARMSAKEIYYSNTAKKQRQAIRNCKKLCLGTCHVRKSLRDKIDLFKNLFLKS